MAVARGGLPAVAVIIVNWNGADDTIACLDSLTRSRGVQWQAYVVDNASTDGSAERIRAAHPATVLIPAASNRGYAGGCNLGIEQAAAGNYEYLCILNNDALVEPDTLRTLAAAACDLGQAVLSPKILYQNRPDVIWYAGGYLGWLLTSHHIGRGERDGAAYDAPRQVSWASGCALFCSTPTARQVGPLDERYFLYLEDVDWCLRAWAKGIPVWYIPQARIFHGVSRSVRRLDERHVRYYGWRNYYLLVREHGNWLQRLCAYGDLASRFAKIAVRQAFFPSFRRNALYHARTRGLMDFVLGRFGPAPFATAAAPTPLADPESVAS